MLDSFSTLDMRKWPSIHPSVHYSWVEFLRRDFLPEFERNSTKIMKLRETKHDNGSSKKKCQQNCSSVFCLTLLLFYSDMVQKQWLKVWFLKSQMPFLSGRINFVPFLKTSKNFFPKIPMKYSKNGQKFAMSKNISNMLFRTFWTPCKKPHFSTWSRSWYTFFLNNPLHYFTAAYGIGFQILFSRYWKSFGTFGCNPIYLPTLTTGSQPGGAPSEHTGLSACVLIHIRGPKGTYK